MLVLPNHDSVLLGEETDQASSATVHSGYVANFPPPSTRAISQSSGQCVMRLQLCQREDSWLFFWYRISITHHTQYPFDSILGEIWKTRERTLYSSVLLSWLTGRSGLCPMDLMLCDNLQLQPQPHTDWLSIGRAKSQTLRNVGLLFVRTVHKGIPRLTGWWLIVMVHLTCKASVYFNKLRVRKI